MEQTVMHQHDYMKCGLTMKNSNEGNDNELPEGNSERSIEEAQLQKNVPMYGDYDVIVAGGGPSGCMAAIAAARNGMSVLLIEKNGFCGGMLTSGLPVQGFNDWMNRPIVRGTAWEFVEQLKSVGGTSGELVPCNLHNPYLIIDPELTKGVLQEMLVECGVKLLYHAVLVSVEQKHSSGSRGRFYRVYSGGKGGMAAFDCSLLIDATGDGDAAAYAGMSYTLGRSPDQLMQAATLNVTIENVNLERLKNKLQKEPDYFDIDTRLDRNSIISDQHHIMVGLRNVIADAKKNSRYSSIADFVCYVTGIHSSSIVMNMIHVNHAEGHTLFGLTNAETAARNKLLPMLDFLKQYIPGFEKAYIAYSSPGIGIRETRHIEGLYLLSRQDVEKGIMFDDAAALGGYPIDIHDPEREDVTLQKIPPYGIPLRCLIPKNSSHLLVTGRAISVDHTAFASSRVMATCMALGQAAGTAAAAAFRNKLPLSDIPYEIVKEELLKNNAVLHVE